MRIISNLKRQAKEFHTKKPHLEFFTALLTIPVLLTVLVLNLNNLKSDKKEEPKTDTIVITQPVNREKEIIVTKEACKAGLGNISIDSPRENDEISDNPVAIDINYEPGEYCEAVWSYRINGGKWSDFDNKGVALYNLPSGNIKLDLRVKSVVNDDEKTLSRNFKYTPEETVTTISTPSPTPSITATQ